MSLTPEEIETLKSFHGLDADEAQLLFDHIDGLEEAIESLRQGALEWKDHAKRFEAALETIATASDDHIKETDLVEIARAALNH